MSSALSGTYLDGPFAPIEDELVTHDLEVVGELPNDLSGMFLRNSPNPRFESEGVYHWFDGDGMIHGIQFNEGRAHYINRYVKTTDLAEEVEAGHALWTGILNPFDPKSSRAPDKNTANTDLIFHNGKLLALWWLGGLPYNIELPSLETLGTESFGGKLPGGMAAHPKVNPRTSELIFFNYNLYNPPYLEYGVIGANGQLSHHCEIEIPGPRLLHDIAITENYTIMTDLPMVWQQGPLEHGQRRVDFDTSLPTRFGVLPQHGDNSAIRWFESPPCYLFHTINAYEDGDEIVVWAPRIQNPLPTTREHLDTTVPRLFFLELRPYLWEWRLNMKTGEVKERQVDDIPTEFPRVNMNVIGENLRYSYNGRIAKQPRLLFDGLVKYDLHQERSDTHEYPGGCYGSEGVFAQSTKDSGEDDGYVLSFVYDSASDSSEVYVIDARSMSSKPIARVKLPRRVPIGFHAWWVPGSAITDSL